MSVLGEGAFSKSGPAPMSVWSKALPLTASWLSTLPGFKSCPGYVRKLPVNWGQAMVFTLVSSTTYNWLVTP